MTQNKEVNIHEGFSKELENLFDQVQTLQKLLYESHFNVAETKTELKSLIANVRSMSTLVDGNGIGSHSIITRMVVLENNIKDIDEYTSEIIECTADLGKRLLLAEQSIKIIEKDIESQKNAISNKIKTDSDEKWKIYAILVGSVFTLLGTVATIIAKAIGAF